MRRTITILLMFALVSCAGQATPTIELAPFETPTLPSEGQLPIRVTIGGHKVIISAIEGDINVLREQVSKFKGAYSLIESPKECVKRGTWYRLQAEIKDAPMGGGQWLFWSGELNLEQLVGAEPQILGVFIGYAGSKERWGFLPLLYFTGKTDVECIYVVPLKLTGKTPTLPNARPE